MADDDAPDQAPPPQTGSVAPAAGVPTGNGALAPSFNLGAFPPSASAPGIPSGLNIPTGSFSPGGGGAGGDMYTRAFGGDAFAADDYRRRQADIDRMKRERDAALDPMRAGIERDLARGVPGPPRQEPLPEPPNPLPEVQKAAAAWVPAAVLFSALAAGLSRGHAAGALTGFGNAMQGFQEGSAAMMKEQRAHWKDQMDKALETNRERLDRYRSVLTANNMNMNQKMLMLQIEAARYNDPIMAAEAQQGNQMEMAKLADGYEKAHLKAQNDTLKLDEQLRNGESLRRRREEQTSIEQQKLEVAKAKQQGSEISDETADRIAAQYNDGDRTAAVGFARSQANQTKIANAITRDMERRGWSAERVSKNLIQFRATQTEENRLANVSALLERSSLEVSQFIPQALAASRDLPRGGNVPINTLIQKWQEGTSNPRYVDFATANYSLKNAFAQAISRTGQTTDMTRRHADELFNIRFSPEAYETLLKRVAQEVQGNRMATERAKQEFLQSQGLPELFPSTMWTPGSPPVAGAPGTAGPPVAPPAGGGGGGWSIQRVD